MTRPKVVWSVFIDYDQEKLRYYIYAADKSTKSVRHPLSRITAESSSETVAVRKARHLQKRIKEVDEGTSVSLRKLY